MMPYAHTYTEVPSEEQGISEPYYWAKTLVDGMPGCTVEQHGLATAAVAEELARSLPPHLLPLLPVGWLTLVAVHDVGKISPRFQTLCPMWRGPYGDASEKQLLKWRMSLEAPTEHPHAMCSEFILKRIYKQRHQKAAYVWAACVGAHHGAFRPVDNSSISLPEDWLNEAIAFVERMEARFGALPCTAPTSDKQKHVRSFVAGLISVADWIASNEDCFPQGNSSQDMRALAAVAVRRIGLVGCPEVTPALLWSDLFPHAREPRALQQHLWEMESFPDVCVIEDAMGGGKTEAALGLAYHLLEYGQCRGLYFALPTQTTSNRIFARVADFLLRCGVPVEERTLRLAHSHSWLMQKSLYADATERISWKRSFSEWSDGLQNLLRWFSSSRRVLLAPFGVGTVDQALMAVLAVKHEAVRSFALAGKTVILDEVHSYDFYTGTLIALLVEHLRRCGSKIIILSATLTGKQCAQLLGVDSLNNEAYPLVSMADGSTVQTRAFPASVQKNVMVECAEVDSATIAERAYSAAEQGQCVLWIRNTVQDAQDAYRLLQAERCEGGPSVGLLHARFPYWRREDLESDWIDALGREATSRPLGCVLVATQVVEQSIDIDADYLITDLAPTDMLLQRIGRLWRHERSPEQRHADKARVLIVTPQGVSTAETEENTERFLAALGSSGRVYAPYVLLQTWKLWRNRESIQLPADIRSLIEATYAESEHVPEWEKTLYQELETQKEKMRRLASVNASAVAGVMPDTEQPPTRYGGMESADVLLLKKAPEMLTPQRWRYVPLHGEPFEVVADEWTFAVARAIHLNMVRVPAWYLKEVASDAAVKQYAMKEIYTCFPMSDGALFTQAEQETGLAWDARIGVYRLSSLPTSHDEI